jgi:hypothetical protein
MRRPDARTSTLSTGLQETGLASMNYLAPVPKCLTFPMGYPRWTFIARSAP